MIIRLNTTKDIPIYLQLRNEIVMGIGRGELKIGDRLPSVRQMAGDIGVNHMTVNKTYSVLKQEGFIIIDRRHGATISPHADTASVCEAKMKTELELLVTESALKGIPQKEFVSEVNRLFGQLNIQTTAANP